MRSSWGYAVAARTTTVCRIPDKLRCLAVVIGRRQARYLSRLPPLKIVIAFVYLLALLGATIYYILLK